MAPSRRQVGPSPSSLASHSLLSGLSNDLIIFDEHQGSPEGLQLVNMAMGPRLTSPATE
jgi:hypothetical protein